MSLHESKPLADDTVVLPVLRLLPAPPSEPPYDDDLTARPALRLVSGPAVTRTAVTRTAVARTAVALTTSRPLPAALPAALTLLPGGVDDDEPAAWRTARADLPAPRPFAHALVQRLLEVLAGLRPVAQLRDDTSVELFEELAELVHGRPPADGPRPTRRDVRSLHVQERADGVAEVCATVQRGDRAGALALRLEGVGGGWRCTALVGV